MSETNNFSGISDTDVDRISQAIIAALDARETKRLNDLNQFIFERFQAETEQIFLMDAERLRRKHV